MNIVMIMGRVVRDPELKYANGIPVCSFSVAVTRRFKKSDGAKGTSTAFVDVRARRRLGEICTQFVKKDRSVFVAGSLSQSRRIDPDGKRLRMLRVIANSVQFLSLPSADPDDPSQR